MASLLAFSSQSVREGARAWRQTVPILATRDQRRIARWTFFTTMYATTCLIALRRRQDTDDKSNRTSSSAPPFLSSFMVRGTSSSRSRSPRWTKPRRASTAPGLFPSGGSPLLSQKQIQRVLKARTSLRSPSSPRIFSSATTQRDSSSSSALFKSYDIKGLADKIKTGQAKKIVVMVGAGISCNAGIPDFRSPGTGLYDNLQAYDLPYPEAVFDLQFFRSNPEPFYRLCKELWPGQYNPTSTHHFINKLHEKGLLLRCFTQNIDSLETLAGLPSEKVVAAHGNFDSAKCITTGENVPINEVKDACLQGADGWMNLKLKYGGLVKPDIVFFGEQLPERFFSCAADDFKKCDLLIVMGTSLVVQPFASLIGFPKSDCPRVLINRERAGESGASMEKSFIFDNEGRDLFIQGDCDTNINDLVERLGWNEKETSNKYI